MKNKAQQEMVGFVLIVVLVVVGLMVYLTISLRSSPENDKSLEVASMLDAIMKQTTGCAIVYVPDYDNFEYLFESAHRGDRCINLNKPAIDYLNETLRDVLSSMVESEASVVGYELQFFEEEGEGILHIEQGNCTRGTIKSAMRSLVSGSQDIVIVLKTCSI